MQPSRAVNSSRRTFLQAAGVSSCLAALAMRRVAAAEKPGRPLLAYVGTFSSPLKDTLPTQVDLPPGNGRGIHRFACAYVIRAA